MSLSGASSTVSRLGVVEVAPRAPKPSQIAPPATPEPAPEPAPGVTVVKEPALLDVVLAAFSGLGYAVSARALLLLAMIGSFTLTTLVMWNPTILRVVVLAVFTVLVVLPLVYLEVRKR